MSRGATNVVGTPEFYWELEVKRLAARFHPQEKFVPLPEGNDGSPSAGYVDPNGTTVQPWMIARKKATEDADTKDFTDALNSGRIKPADPAEAARQHAAARIFLKTANADTAAPLPDEFSSEFADYHRGALAYLRGKEHWDEARQAWESLLQRPEAERHYRSVWAAFMLGKLAMKSGSPDAPRWFQRTRQLAKDGFADSLGMAADSYGWEGRSEYKQGHPENAAPLFLNQLAAGDDSAIVSLKALIPDRVPSQCMLNYGPSFEEVQAMPEEQEKAEEDKTLEALQRAAANPMLRRLVTAHILSSETGWFGQEPDASHNRRARWLEQVNAAKPGKLEDAEYLGWVAYNNGAYKEAARWLGIADPKAPAACWLRAKLQLREGKNEEAARSLSSAITSLRDPVAYTGWKSGFTGGQGPYAISEPGSWSFAESACGDFGQLQLARNDFLQAFDVFFTAGLWEDASYVAERVLTADELKAYVDKMPGHASKKDEGESFPPDPNKALRGLLGRKLVREGRMGEAKAYLAPEHSAVLGRYVAALRESKSERLAKKDRAKALFAAAWIARHSGMEIMGTEVAPDGAVYDGDFERFDIAKERLSGQYLFTDYGSYSEPEKSELRAIPLKATDQEKQRIRQNKIQPDRRWHYRYIAADMAMRAAQLLQDNTEELADVINCAGLWVRNTDEKLGERYYNVLERRAAGTEIGKQALAKHWFVDMKGPWSAELANADEVRQQAAPPDPNAAPGE